MVLPVPDYDKSSNMECFFVTRHRPICLETYVLAFSSSGLSYNTLQNTSTNIVVINIVSDTCLVSMSLRSLRFVTSIEINHISTGISQYVSCYPYQNT